MPDSPSPNMEPPSPEDRPRASLRRIGELLAASRGWQTLIAAVVTAVAAIIAAILATGDDGNGHRQTTTTTQATTTAPASVSVDSVSQAQDTTHRHKWIVTLTGRFDGLQPGWSIYALGQRTDARSAKDWSAQPAEVNEKNKSWTARLIFDQPAEMRWSAVLIHERVGAPACPTNVPCETNGPEDELATEGPSSDLVQASASPTNVPITDAPH